MKMPQDMRKMEEEMRRGCGCNVRKGRENYYAWENWKYKL